MGWHAGREGFAVFVDDGLGKGFLIPLVELRVRKLIKICWCLKEDVSKVKIYLI